MKRLIELADRHARAVIGDYYIIHKNLVDNINQELDNTAKNEKTLTQIVAVAHFGGLLNLTSDEVLQTIRLLTLHYAGKKDTSTEEWAQIIRETYDVVVGKARQNIANSTESSRTEEDM